MILSRKQSLSLFIVLIISCIVGSLMQTSMTTILPAIMKELKISTGDAQWLTSAFTLAMGIMIPVTPFLLKRFSTRKIIISSLAIFSIGLLITGLADTFTIMLIGRVLQALCSGVFVSLTQVAVVQIFPVEKTGTYMGIYGLAVGGVPVFAPTLAGVISDTFGYRYIFIGGAALTIITLIMALLFAANITKGEKTQLDSISLFLSVIGSGGLTLALQNLLSQHTKQLGLICLLISLVALVLFVFRQKKSEEPFLNLRTFQNSHFLMAVIGSVLLYAVMMAGSLILPIYLQTLRGLTSTDSGLITLPGSLVMIIFSPIAGKIYDRVGIRSILLVGSMVLFISCLGLSFVTYATPIWYIVTIYMFRMMAISLLMMPLVSWGLSGLEEKLTVHGSALISSLRTFAGAFSMVGITSLMTSIGSGKVTLPGLNLAFIALTIITIPFIVLAVIVNKSK